MERYLQIFLDGYRGYAGYLWSEVTTPGPFNYFYWLIGASLFFFVLEIVMPWRKNQKTFRKDFWLDVFYMFFNFFLFSLIIYNAASNVVVEAFNDGLGAIGITNLVAIEVSGWPIWLQLVSLFVIRDFIQWNVHRLLHRVHWLWEFHKVHHSVEEMGFAAHLRYHWMENVVYNALQYIPLAMIGFGIDDFFIVYVFSLAVGHFNHSNIRVPLGPLKYILNNPQMHIWHHAKAWPEGRDHGINFGITLSLWDYLFGTADIPSDGRDIRLGFPGSEDFPKDFVHQSLHGLRPGGDES
ncbi:MAG: sterol desaturase/sphingolipid hydroxylase (fatty acid hydroxylase superfamily) [Rhodothermales bacterium]|jgi:sterol desaturase/sphingolipid hydroxylase (fatty acid hydroxylase superfamily)